MNAGVEEAVMLLLRASLALAVSALIVGGLIRLVRPSSPTVQRVGWFAVLLQGVVLIQLPIHIAWYEAGPSGGGTTAMRPKAAASPLTSLEPVRVGALDAPIADADSAGAVGPQSRSHSAPGRGSSGGADLPPWPQVAAIVWLVGLILLPAALGLSYVRFLWQVCRSRAAPAEWSAQWQSVLAVQRVGRSIALRVTGELGPAMCWTPWGYRVLVPERVWRELSGGQRAAILRHELAHYRRGDLSKLLAARALALVHWFNPLAWWAVHKFSQCAEWACDQAAVGSRREEAAEYAKALVQLSVATAPCGVHGTAMRGGSLFRRIHRLVSAPTRKDTTMKKAVLLGVVLCLMAINVVRFELVAKEPSGADPPTVGRSGPSPQAPANLQRDPLPEGALARAGSVRLRHGDMVRRVVFVPDGKRLASWADDQAFCVWDAETGRLLRRDEFPRQGLADVVLPTGPAAAFALVAAGNGTIHRWEFADLGQPAPSLEPWPPFRGHVFYVAVGDDQEEFGRWAVSPDGKTLAGASSGLTDRKRMVRFWQLESGKKRDDLAVLGESERVLDRVRWMGFSPDGQVLVALNEAGPRYNPLKERENPATRQYSAIVFSNPDGQELRRIELAQLSVFGMRHPLAISPDRRILAAVSTEKAIHLYDLQSGERVRRLEGHASEVKGVAFSPDGKLLASCERPGKGNSVRLWDVATGALLRELEGYRAAVETMAFSPDGRILATGAQDNRVRLWDVATGKGVRGGQGHQRIIFSLAISLDGRFLATGSADQTVRLWDPRTGTERWRARMPAGRSIAVAAVAISPDGKRVAAGGETIRLFDAASGQETLQFEQEGHSAGFNSLAFTSDGKRLVSVGPRDKTARLWDVDSGRQLRHFVHSTEPRALAISPDDQTLAVSEHTRYAGSTVIRLWDVETGEQLRKLQPQKGNVEALGFSPDGKTLASGGHSTARGYRVTDNADLASAGFGDSLELWDVDTGDLVRQFPIPSVPEWVSRRNVHSVAFSPEGTHLISGEHDGTLRIYDVATGDLVRTLRGHYGQIRSVAVSAEGRILASAGADTTALIWDLGRVLAQPTRPSR